MEQKDYQSYQKIWDIIFYSYLLDLILKKQFIKLEHVFNNTNSYILISVIFITSIFWSNKTYLNDIYNIKNNKKYHLLLGYIIPIIIIFYFLYIILIKHIPKEIIINNYLVFFVYLITFISFLKSFKKFKLNEYTGMLLSILPLFFLRIAFLILSITACKESFSIFSIYIITGILTHFSLKKDFRDYSISKDV